MLQDELREVVNKEVDEWFGKQIKEKSKGRNHDLTVAKYKVAQKTEHLQEILGIGAEQKRLWDVYEGR